MKRSLYSEEHQMYCEAFRTFIEREVLPNQETWQADGIVSREVWRKGGEAGFLCAWLEPEYGGPGGDFLCSVVVTEELARVYESGLAFMLHSDIVVPYIHSYGSQAQKERWLPLCASGEVITAIAMTEPGTGSDLAAIRTRATPDGDHYVLNGSKTFISNGKLCDLCIVVANTGNNPEDPHNSLSLFLVDTTTPGFIKGRLLKKMGMMGQDTCEITLENCRVPKDALLGGEGAAFMMLMSKLQQERLMVAIAAQANAGKIVEDTVAYCKERQAFGRPISKFQNTQFKLVDCATEVEVGQHFLDALIQRHAEGEYLVKECSMAKCWQTEMLGRVVDTCLQFFGGYGYMLEYPITRAYMDARVQRIYAGTNEIMRLIVARSMGL